MKDARVVVFQDRRTGAYSVDITSPQFYVAKTHFELACGVEIVAACDVPGKYVLETVRTLREIPPEGNVPSILGLYSRLEQRVEK